MARPMHEKYRHIALQSSGGPRKGEGSVRETAE